MYSSFGIFLSIQLARKNVPTVEGRLKKVKPGADGETKNGKVQQEKCKSRKNPHKNHRIIFNISI